MNDSEKRERTRPGFCDGLPLFFYFVFVYFIIKVFKCLPVPAFFSIYELCYIGAKTKEEGGTRCQGALAAEGNRSAEECSPVSNPMKELLEDKRRSEDRERQERTRPEFYFVFCERQSSLRGCCFSFMFVYFIIKVFKAGFHLLLPDLRTVLQLLTLMLFIHD